MNSFIYGLVDPRTSFVRYVGLTTSGMRRPKRHKSEHVGSQSRIMWVKELQSLGLDFEIVVLEEIPDPHSPAITPMWVHVKRNLTRLPEAEIWWIAYGRARGWPLTNVTDGGLGARGTKHSPETIAKMRLVQKKSPETRAKLSAAHKKLTISPETRARIAASKTGFKASAATRAKMSATRKGRPMPAEVRAKISASKQLRPYIPTAETIAKVAAAHRGKKHTAAHKQAIGDAFRGRKYTPEHCAAISAGHARRRAAKLANHSSGGTV